MDIPEKESQIAGILHQTAVDAANKKFEKICGIDGYDRAFWDIDITLELKSLSTEDFKPMRSVIVKNKIYE